MQPARNPPATLLVYGSSLSAEWNWRLWRRNGGHWVRCLRREWRQRKPERRIVNASRWGADSNWAVAQFEQRVARHRPQWLTLEFAVNDADLRRGITLARSRSNLEQMLDQTLSWQTPCRSFLWTGGPVQGRHAAVRPGLQEYLAMWRTVADERAIDLIDLASVWRTDKGFLPDGLHPGKAAGQQILPLLSRSLG